ncbi:MAG: Trm112 family protein [Thermomicrobiales bacterium]
MSASSDHIVSDELMAILVCPVDHGKLEIVDSALRCTVCGRVFPVNDGIPNMLVDE